MGRAKKSEKSARSEEQEDKEPEPYQPTGNFQTDFAELCKELEINRPPAVLVRAKRPASPDKVEHTQAPTGKKGKEDKRASAAQQQQQLAEPEEETPEEKAVIEMLGFKPKTFTVRNHLDLMRPSIQVEMDIPDRQDSVSEVFIKDWKLQAPMLMTLGRCFEKLQRLHSIHLWRVAADAAVVSSLADLLTRLPTVKSLELESNGPLPEENYAELIRVESNLVRLRLRFNQIGDKCAALIGEQLNGLREAPSKLISLDLSCNCIQDDGAMALAKALRTNRTLIHLSLSNNHLTDKAAAALAQVCSRFFLTHEETVQRRRLMSVDARFGGSVSHPQQFGDAPPADAAARHPNLHHNSSSNPAAITSANNNTANNTNSSLHPRALTNSPPPSRRGADRPASVRSQEKDKDNKKAATPAAVKGGKGKKDEKAKPEEKGTKGKAPQKDEAKAKGKASAPAQQEKDPKGAAKSGKGKGARVKMTTPQPDPAEPELQYDTEHPLLEKADTTYAPGYLLVPGNYALALLNLSRNQITQRGVEEWKTAIRYQAAYMCKQKVHGTGMLKLMLQGNPFSTDADSFKILDDAMNAKDPLRPGISETST